MRGRSGELMRRMGKGRKAGSSGEDWLEPGGDGVECWVLGFGGTAEKCAAVTGAFHNVVPAAGGEADPASHFGRSTAAGFPGLIDRKSSG
jgi:hypothetical protein